MNRYGVQMYIRAHGTLWAIIHLRCPRCHHGKVFNGIFSMNVRCPVCRLVFEREPGYFLGAMYVSARGVKRDYVEGLAWFIVAKKSGAPADAEEQVRHRLARRPADIAAAEARAAEIAADLANATPRTGAALPAKPEPPAPAKPEVVAPKLDPVAPPRIDVSVPPPPAMPTDEKK